MKIVCDCGNEAKFVDKEPIGEDGRIMFAILQSKINVYTEYNGDDVYFHCANCDKMIAIYVSK